MEGKLVAYSSASGDGGVYSYTAAVNRALIGSSASKRLMLGLGTPYYGENLRAKLVLMDLGFIIPRGVGLPFRVVVAVDGVTITREFKPQILVEVEEGVYGKAVYDATALLGARIVSSDLHRLSIIYTAEKPVIFEESGLAVLYEGIEGGWYSYSMLGGALSMEPGDIVEVDVNLPSSRVDTKQVIVKMHVPSRHADLRVEVGGKTIDAGGVHGPTTLEFPVRHRGSRIRAYFYYNKAERRFYPRKAVISTIVVSENLVPKADVKVVDAQPAGGGRALLLTLRNDGEVRASDVSILVFSGGTIAGKTLVGELDVGDEVKAEVPLSAGAAGDLLVRVLWKSYGRTSHTDRIIRIPGGSA